MFQRITSLVCVSFTALAMLSGCGKKESGKSANLPLIAPPVKRTVAKGLLSGAAALSLDDATSAIRSRFFSEGPTNILGILTTIDSRLAVINTRSASSEAPCVSQAPVAYTITAYGRPITMYAQCYEVMTGAVERDPKLLQFGVKDGITYLFMAIGAGRVAAIATPIAGQTGKYSVEAWMSVGATNPVWDSMSYGVIALKSDESSNKFEMTVAGMGFGYCGAQLKSDSTNLYLTGSSDMGNSCNATANTCVLTSDAVTAGTCSTELSTFELAPLGRLAVQGTSNTFGASTYPAVPNITLNGTMTDSVFFGPNVHTEGAGSFAVKTSK